MKQNIIKSVLISLFLITHITVASELSLSFGSTGEGEMTQRVAYATAWDKRWLDSSVGFLSGYWDAGYTRWAKGDYGKVSHAISLAPVFVYEFYTKGGYQPFIELGIGAAFFSTTKVGSQKLGSSFNFEDRIGVGIKKGRHRFGLRAIHYSNLGLKKPNQGIESYALYYSYHF